MNGSLKVYWAALMSMTLWASAFVAIRIGLEDFSPGALALLRFGVASVCMWFMVKIKLSHHIIPWAVRLRLMLIGVIGITIYHTALNYGEQTLSAGITSFVIGLMPVFTIVLSVIFLKERPGPYALQGVLVSLMGLLIIMLGEHQPISISSGVVFVLVSAIAGAIQTVSQKTYSHQYHPIAVSAWVIWGGTLVLCWFLPDLIREWQGLTRTASLAGIYLGIFPAAIAYMFWGFVLRFLPASRAAMFFYGLPIFSTILGFVLLQETPSILSLSGGAVAILGALLAAKKQPFTASDTKVSPSRA